MFVYIIQRPLSPRSHPRDHKSRGGARTAPHEASAAATAVVVVVAVAVTSILATWRALGIFYKNNLTRFLQEQQQQQQCLTESTLSRLPCKSRPHRPHHRELPRLFLCLYPPSSSTSLSCSSTHTLTCCRIPQMPFKLSRFHSYSLALYLSFSFTHLPSFC